MIVFFILTGVIIFCTLVLTRASWLLHIQRARKKGLYPPAGRATLFDVKRLLTSGEKAVAIQVYRQIYRVGFKEALKAVEELEKSIKASRKQY